MGWPQQGPWLAMADAQVRADGGIWSTRPVDCGKLVMPTGQLVTCDPFATLQSEGNPYASLVLRDEPEVRPSVLQPRPDGGSVPELAPGEYVGFPVDAGTACPILGGYDAAGRMVAVHVDLMVIPPDAELLSSGGAVRGSCGESTCFRACKARRSGR